MLEKGRGGGEPLNRIFTSICDLEAWHIGNTVNVDIFAHVNFRAVPKIGDFAQKNIHVFDIFASMWHYKSYFHDVHIFADINFD